MGTNVHGHASSNLLIIRQISRRCFQPIKFLLVKLQATSLRTSSTIFLSQVASLNALLNSILAVSASGDNSFGGGIAESAKSTFAFAIVISISRSKVIFADIATVGEAVDTTHSGVVVAGRSHDNASEENNGLFQFSKDRK